MPDSIKRFLIGISEVLPTLGSGREYPKYEGFSADARNLRSDWVEIGSDMKKAIKKEKESRKTEVLAHG